MQTTTTDGYERSLLRHYAAVKNRLGAPRNMPAKNNLKRILTEAQRRAEQLKAEAERLRRLAKEERARVRDEENAARLALNTEYARRISAARRAFVNRHKEAALGDFDRQMEACPFKAKDSPGFRELVKTITGHYRVTWVELISGKRSRHVLLARATFYMALREIGLSDYRIARLTGRNPNTSRQIAQLIDGWGAKARDNVCFSRAISCAKNISTEELNRWTARPAPAFAKKP